MPLYAYVCLDCKKEFELLRPMGQADDPAPCAHCGGDHVRRKLAVFYAQSGGHAVSGTSTPSCGSCAGGNCSSCGH